MTTIEDIIKLKAPGLYGDVNLSAWITLSKTKIDSCYYGKLYNEAVALQAAHDYTLSNRMLGASGAISSIREGDLSVSYGTGGSNGDLSSTHYGMQLKNLTDKSNMAIDIIGCDTGLC